MPKSKQWLQEKLDFICSVIPDVDQRSLLKELMKCESDEEAQMIMQSLLLAHERTQPGYNRKSPSRHIGGPSGSNNNNYPIGIPKRKNRGIQITGNDSVRNENTPGNVTKRGIKSTATCNCKTCKKPAQNLSSRNNDQDNDAAVNSDQEGRNATTHAVNNHGQWYICNDCNKIVLCPLTMEKEKTQNMPLQPQEAVEPLIVPKVHDHGHMCNCCNSSSDRKQHQHTHNKRELIMEMPEGFNEYRNADAKSTSSTTTANEQDSYEDTHHSFRAEKNITVADHREKEFPCLEKHQCKEPKQGCRDYEINITLKKANPEDNYEGSGAPHCSITRKKGNDNDDDSKWSLAPRSVTCDRMRGAIPKSNGATRKKTYIETNWTEGTYTLGMGPATPPSHSGYSNNGASASIYPDRDLQMLRDGMEELDFGESQLQENGRDKHNKRMGTSWSRFSPERQGE